VPTTSGSQRRRRRGTTKSNARPVPEEVLGREEAEELLKMVQGHLVLWPYEWYVLIHRNVSSRVLTSFCAVGWKKKREVVIGCTTLTSWHRWRYTTELLLFLLACIAWKGLGILQRGLSICSIQRGVAYLRPLIDTIESSLRSHPCGATEEEKTSRLLLNHLGWLLRAVIKVSCIERFSKVLSHAKIYSLLLNPHITRNLTYVLCLYLAVAPF
jgi:hypothetical protein